MSLGLDCRLRASLVHSVIVGVQTEVGMLQLLEFMDSIVVLFDQTAAFLMSSGSSV